MAITPYRFTSDLLPPMFEDLLGPLAGWGGRMNGLLRAPEADVTETEDQIQVVVELPGTRREDIEIDLENNVLTIRGEKQEARVEEKDTWHLSERRYGTFSRTFVLPGDVERERIEAHFANGVLRVTVPKSERGRRRRIAIQEGGGQQRLDVETGGRK